MNRCHVKRTLPISALIENEAKRIQVLTEQNFYFNRAVCRPSLAAWFYLHVNISPVVDQELQTECSVCGGSSEVQRGEAFVVGLADVGAVVDQLTDDGILAVETGDVERRVAEGIGLVNLLAHRRKHDRNGRDARQNC